MIHIFFWWHIKLIHYSLERKKIMVFSERLCGFERLYVAFSIFLHKILQSQIIHFAQSIKKITLYLNIPHKQNITSLQKPTCGPSIITKWSEKHLQKYTI